MHEEEAPQRFQHNPLLHVDQHPALGGNANGPSVIRVPSWVQEPLGRYYMYLAHHQGEGIRLAYADEVDGPWQLYRGQVLHKEDTPYEDHIASPDVHVDEERRCIWMMYHGCSPEMQGKDQKSSYAESPDGLRFHSDQTCFPDPYHRWVKIRESWYMFSGGSGRRLYRSRRPGEEMEPGPVLELEGESFSGAYRLRHVALDLRGNELDIYFSAVGDCPERIRACSVKISGDWWQWRAGPSREILTAERTYEAADLPLSASRSGSVHVPVHQLRDPYVFREQGKRFLFYSIAGEQGIAGARLDASVPSSA